MPVSLHAGVGIAWHPGYLRELSTLSAVVGSVQDKRWLSLGTAACLALGRQVCVQSTRCCVGFSLECWCPVSVGGGLSKCNFSAA